MVKSVDQMSPQKTEQHFDRIVLKMTPADSEPPSDLVPVSAEGA